MTKTAGNDRAIGIILDTVGKTSERDTAVMYGIPLHVVSGVVCGTITELTAVSVRKVNSVVVNREKQKRQEETLAVVENHRYKGNRNHDRQVKKHNTLWF